MTNLGKWDRWYAGLDREDPQPYGDTTSYEMGAKFLADCPTVADWGCGKGWFRRYVTGRYVGVDGSHSPFADVIADLAEYREPSDGIFMRHVLEHDWRWEQILANAVAAFRQRFVLVLFTPLSDTTHEIAFAEDPGVPDISFAERDIMAHLDGLAYVDTLSLATATQYGGETIFMVAR